MAGDLGSLIVSIGTDLKDLDKGLSTAQKNIEGFQKSANKILGLIGFSLTAAAFVELGKRTLEYGETLHKLSLQTGLAASEIGKLKYVAEQSETSVDAVARSFRFLAKVISEAHGGGKEAIGTFSQFGVQFNNLDGTMRNTNDVFLEMADRIKNTKNQTVVLAEGQKVFGRGMLEILPLLKEGSDGIKKLTDRYQEMQGKVGITDDEINKFAKDSDALGDSWKDVGTAFQFTMVEVLTPFLPKLKEFTEFLVDTNWSAVAEDILAVADAIGKIFKFMTDSVQLSPVGRFIAGVSAAAGTIDGGGSMEDANEAAAAAFLDPQAAGRERYGSESNPVDLGVIQANGPTAGDGQGISAGAGNFESRFGVGKGQQAPAGFFQGGGDGVLGINFGDITAKMEELKTKWQDVSKQMGEVWGKSMEMITTGFGTSVAGMIVDGDNFGESMKKMWADVAKMAIAEIVKIIAQQIILFGWQVVTGTVGSGNITGGGKGKKFFFFKDGGAIPQARNGLMMGAGMRQTGNMGESGIPAIVHPGEVISPIDKLFEFMGRMQPSSITVHANGRAGDDPQLLAEYIQLESDRQRRRP